jgi:hypothetical protein
MSVTLNLTSVAVVAAFYRVSWAIGTPAFIFIAKSSQSEDMRIEAIVRLRVDRALSLEARS